MTKEEELVAEWKDAYKTLDLMQKDRMVFKRYGTDYPDQEDFDQLALACQIIEAQLALMSDPDKKRTGISYILQQWEKSQ